MFFIEKIIIHTKLGKPSCLEFTSGLNIIYGPSNTGKSLVVSCLNYMLGATEQSFDANLGIKSITLIVRNENQNKIIISREVNKKYFDVSSNVPDIDAGTYSIKSGNFNIDNLWLKLAGIQTNVKIINNKYEEVTTLTFDKISHLFLIDELRIQEKNSILAKKHSEYVATYVLTALLYLATGNTYVGNEQPVENTRLKMAKNKAVRVFIDKSIALLSEQQGDLDVSASDLEKEVYQIVDEIGAAKGTLQKALERSHLLGDKINNLNDGIAQIEVVLNRNEILLTQYQSDIQRLSFIVEGEAHHVESPLLCPFCGSPLYNKPLEKSCLHAAIAEEQKIELQVKDLQSLQESMQSELLDLQNQRKNILKEREYTEGRIRGELKPQIQALKEKLAAYSSALQKQKQIECIKNLTKYFQEERSNMDKDMSSSSRFDVKGRFKTVFTPLLDQILKDILYKSDYRHYTESYFDYQTEDIVVNGHAKETQGKGYRAYLNAVVAVAIHQCLKKLQDYQFPFMVIDSPVLSVKDIDNKAEALPESMKRGLFQYFVQWQDAPQLILIENDIPKIDYENANLIQFTKDSTIGRYGLINGYED